MFRALVLLLATQAPPSPEASATDEAALRLRLSLGAEWDTNAARAVSLGAVNQAAVSQAGELEGDGLARLLVDMFGRVPIGEAHELRASYLLGAKRFAGAKTEDVLVHDLSLSSAHGVTPWLTGLAHGTFRSSRIRNGLRDYDLGVAGLRSILHAAEALDIDLGGAITRFTWSFESRLSHVAPQAGGGLTWRVGSGLEAQIHADYVFRRYDGNALVVGATPTDMNFLTFCDDAEEISQYQIRCESKRRHDDELQLSAGLRYQGPIVVGLRYLLRMQRSNSELENVDRHRISAQGTAELPWRLFLNVLAALQINTGVSVTDTRYLAEDDENQNSVQVQLGRALTDELSLELRYALFTNQFTTSDVSFLRHTAYLGLSFRTGRE